MKQLNEFKWQIFAAALLIGALVLSHGAGLRVLLPLGRFALPLIVVAFAFRYVKKRIMTTVADALKKQMEAAGLRPPNGPKGRESPRGDESKPVIDLCPKCGGYLAAGHRCQR